MKAMFAWAALLVIFVVPAMAADCSVSKEFHIKRPQVLAGVLQDPNDAALSGMGLDLLSGTKIVQRVRTNNQGAYDFGMVPAGTYRVHFHYGSDPFCAPKVQCGSQGCLLQPKLQINLKNAVLGR